jgi:hypothetical protein
MSGLNFFSRQQQDIPLKSQAFEAAPQDLAPAGKPFPPGKRILSRRGGKRFPTEGTTYADENQCAVITPIAQCWDGTTCPKTGRVVPMQSCLRFANRKFDLRIAAGWRNDRSCATGVTLPRPDNLPDASQRTPSNRRRSVRPLVFHQGNLVATPLWYV